MCNYEQTALNKARLFAPAEYLFVTKTFPQTSSEFTNNIKVFQIE